MEFCGYAYRDKHGIIHVASDRLTAEKFSSDGRVEFYGGPHRGGLPVPFSRHRIFISPEGVEYRGKKHGKNTWPADSAGLREYLGKLGF